MTIILNEDQQKYMEALEAYEIGKPIMSDMQFDRLEAIIRRDTPDWKQLSLTGVRTKKHDYFLTRYMPSLDKQYPKTFSKWLERNNQESYYVSHKFDGSSIQAEIENHQLVRLVTRGDGEIGGNITHLIPYLNIAKQYKEKNMIVRLEAIMRNDVFDEKYSSDYDNPRNLVAGMLDRDLNNTRLDDLKDIDFIALSVFDKEVTFLDTISELDVAEVFECDKDSIEEFCTDLILNHDLPYNTDGVVITLANSPIEHTENRNPKYQIAFKVNDMTQAKETTIVNVEWNESFTGKLVPRIEIEPVEIDNTTITYASAHNPEIMIKQGIGVGAKVLIIKSGDIIPYIVDVIEPAEMCEPDVPYVKNGKFYYAVTQSDTAARKRVERFIQTNNINDIGLSRIEALGITTIDELFNLVLNDYKNTNLSVLGANQGIKLHTELQALRSIDIINFIVGLGNVEGLGVKRFKVIQEYIPIKELIETPSKLNNIQIRGIGDKIKKVVIDALEDAKPLYTKYKDYIEFTEKIKKMETVSSKFTGKVACWTGYRNTDQENHWLSLGGKVASSVSGKTDYLFYNPEKQNSKTAKHEKILAVFSDMFPNA